MSTTVVRTLRHAFALLIVGALAAACGQDEPTEPIGIIAPSVSEFRAADLGSCEKLAAPAGSQLAFHSYADGVQIYRWNGSAWAFVAPEATLAANVGGQGVVGIHYAGPTWETFGGSRITATVADRCTYDPSAIQWLLLNVATNNQMGVLHGVTHIQRVNTVAGTAPAQPGTTVGEERRMHYTAEYFFYRAP